MVSLAIFRRLCKDVHPRWLSRLVGSTDCRFEQSYALQKTMFTNTKVGRCSMEEDAKILYGGTAPSLLCDAARVGCKAICGTTAMSLLICTDS